MRMTLYCGEVTKAPVVLRLGNGWTRASGEALKTYSRGSMTCSRTHQGEPTWQSMPFAPELLTQSAYPPTGSPMPIALRSRGKSMRCCRMG